MYYKSYFKDKRVTIMGLGLLGRGVGDAVFLAESGAKLTITDLKPRAALGPSLSKLRKFKNIRYVLDGHKLEDFSARGGSAFGGRGPDMILKAAGVPLDSLYIKEALKHKIPVEMSAVLFAKLSGLPMIGITGTRGKSTVTHLIANILRLAGKKIILGGNIRGVSNLQLLKKVKGADLSVFELDSWQLQGFGGDQVSPHISVFTNFLSDHMNYYKGDSKKYFNDKSFIYKFQNKNDILVLGPQIRNLAKGAKSKIINADLKNIPKSWHVRLEGGHNLENIACAIKVARFLKIKESVIKRAVENFKAISGRLELIKDIRGIKIYNDNSSTTPDSTIAALRSLGNKNKRKIVLIIGGDKKFLDMSKLLIEIPKWCSKVVLFKEQGTDLIREKVFKFGKKGINVYEEEGLSNTVRRAFNIAQKGEIVLYSPAFSSFGKYFQNEFDRGDQFMKIVKKLK